MKILIAALVVIFMFLPGVPALASGCVSEATFTHHVTGQKLVTIKVCNSVAGTGHYYSVHNNTTVKAYICWDEIRPGRKNSGLCSTFNGGGYSTYSCSDCLSYSFELLKFESRE